MLHLINRANSTPALVSLASIDLKLKHLLRTGPPDHALHFYLDEIHPSGVRFVLPSVIKACASAQLPNLGLQLHCIALKSGADADPVTSNSLLSMYDKLGSVERARKVFDEMRERDGVTWNAMVNCYVRNGRVGSGLGMVGRMWGCGFRPKPELLASVVSASRGIEGFRLGRAIHAFLLVNDLFDEEEESLAFLLTALVDLYMRFGDPAAARRVFFQINLRNEVSWSAMVAGWCDNQDYDAAVDWLRAMQAEGIKPNRVTLVPILSASSKHGSEIHGYAFRHGFHSECCFSGALIHMYGRNGGLRRLKLVFERASEKDVFLWSSMIGAFGHLRKTQEMLKLFNRMREEGIEPSSVTLLSMISAFSSAASLNHSSSVHGLALKRGMDLEPSLGNCLITMYAKTGCLDAAVKVFHDMPVKDSVSWTALMHAYALNGQGPEALRLFSEMRAGGLRPDQTSLLVALSACQHAGLVEEGRKIFSYAEEEGELELTVEHYACYVDLLAKAGLFRDACDAACSMPMRPSDGIWTSLIWGFRNGGRFQEAERLASERIRSEPDQAPNYAMLGSVCAESGKWRIVEDIRKHARLKGLKKTRGISQIQL